MHIAEEGFLLPHEVLFVHSYEDLVHFQAQLGPSALLDFDVAKVG